MTTPITATPPSLLPFWSSASTEQELRSIFDTSKTSVMFLVVHSNPLDNNNNNNNNNNNQLIIADLKSAAEKCLEQDFLSDERVKKALLKKQPRKKGEKTQHVPLLSLELVEWKINLMEQGSFSKTLAAAMNIPLLGVTLGAVYKGELLDIIKIDDGIPKSEKTVSLDQDAVFSFSKKFAQFCFHKMFLSATTNTGDIAKKTNEGDGASVDVAKLLSMGKDLLAKRSPVYAEKFFTKAIDTLDAIVSDPAMQMKLKEENRHSASNNNNNSSDNTTNEKNDKAVAELDNISDIVASLADALAWRALSRFVTGENSQGVSSDVEKISKALRWSPSAEVMARAPLGVVLRAETLASMNDALANLSAEAKWTEKECSEKTLRKNLEKDPKGDTVSRALLVFTLFLSGDVERCLTEAIKLKSHGCSFGTSALTAITRFLGPDHELVKKL